MKLRFTPEALSEFRELLEYTESHSRQGAVNINARIQRILKNLADYPLSGTMTNVADMRRIAVTPYPYLIFYLVAPDEIVIVGIRHAARDPASMPDSSGDL